MNEQLALLPEYLTAHLQLSLVALLLGALISVPLGVWVVRHPRLEAALLAVASLIQTIPSLALLAVMVPALAFLSSVTQARFGFEVQSIGFVPALIALTLYSMLPMLRNAVTGLAGVDPALTEAARGVGMTSWQRLWRVELPQAVPMIVAGVRTATVWVVGMTVLSTPVGAPSLGNYIFTGLQTRNSAAVLVGCVSAAALAMVLDVLIRTLEVGGQGGHKKRTLLALGAILALYGYVGHSLFAGRRQPPHGEIRIGAKSFTEQYILAELLAAHLRARGATDAVRIVQSLGSSVAFDALTSGAIDVYVEYSGTVWTTLMKRPDTVPREVLQAQVRAFLAEHDGVAVSATLGFENTYGLAMPRKEAARRNITDIPTLAAVAPTLRVAGDYEIFGRAEWAALQRTYNLTFASQRSMDPALMYEAVAHGSVDVIAAYSSDGRLATQDMIVLPEPRHVIPPYDALVLTGPGLRHNQAALQALAELGGKLSLTDMQRLNAEVDAGRGSPSDVARRWVEAH